MRKLALNNKLFSEYNEISCYWGGFIAADGNVAKDCKKFSIALSSKDHDHLLKLKSDLRSSHKISQLKRKDGTLISSLVIRDAELCNDLESNFNIVPNKSLVYIPPDWIEGRLMRHFVRGIFDGDGCISQTRTNGYIYPHVSFVSGSSICITNINNFLSQQCLVNSSICKIGNSYRIQWTGSSAEAVVDYLYRDSSRFLSRKYKKYAELQL
jgi:hypothetical protein